jgi:membrane-anchored glycerophosphoryl diester phosphodiesterase (GDPDase)
MNNDQASPLFGLNIDPVSKSFLHDAARWGKFLAIVGFVIIGIMMISGITVIMLGPGSFYYDDSNFDTDMYPAMMGGLIVMMVLVGLIYFFPCYYLFRFSDKMKVALASNDQETLNKSFKNLKSLLRYVGILTLIFVIMFGVSLLVNLLTLVGSRS